MMWGLGMIWSAVAAVLIGLGVGTVSPLDYDTAVDREELQVCLDEYWYLLHGRYEQDSCFGLFDLDGDGIPELAVCKEIRQGLRRTLLVEGYHFGGNGVERFLIRAVPANGSFFYCPERGRLVSVSHNLSGTCSFYRCEEWLDGELICVGTAGEGHGCYAVDSVACDEASFMEQLAALSGNADGSLEGYTELRFDWRWDQMDEVLG